MCLKRNTGERSRNYCCNKIAIRMEYYECVFVFLPQLCDMWTTCLALFSRLWPIWLYHIFPHYLINCIIFIKKSLNIKCVPIFSTSFPKKYLILRMLRRDITTNVHRPSCKVPLLLTDFNQNLTFSTDFQKSSNIKLDEKPSSGNWVVFQADG